MSITSEVKDEVKDMGVQARHQAELDAGRFLIQHCGDCKRHIYYPREVCPHCGASAHLTLVPAKGSGTVYSVTTMRRKAEAGGDYNVSLIDLDEGVRMMSRVDNIPAAEVKIGMRVRARVQVQEGRGVVLFDTMQGGAQ